MSAEQEPIRPQEFEVPLPEEEDQVLIDDAAKDAMQLSLQDSAEADAEHRTTDVVQPTRQARPRRPKREYDPLRDGPAITSDDFDDLVPQFTDPLMRFLMAKIGIRHIAEEYVQETFVRAHASVAHKGTVIGMRFASPWLYRIAENLAYDYFRRKRLIEWSSLDAPVEAKSGKARETLGDTLTAEADSDDLPAKMDNQVAVRAVLAWMPIHMRAHILYEYDGVSSTERAKIAGTSADAMKMQSSRAQRLFKEAFHYYMTHGRVPNRVFKDLGSVARLRYMTAAQRELGDLANL